MNQFLIAVDQLINTTIPSYGDAWADETFSARCWRNGKNDKYWNMIRIAVDTILFFDKEHCFESYISEYERKHLPEEYHNNK